LQIATQCENLQIDENHCVAVKEAIKNQAKSGARFHHRAGRITASKFKAVCRTNMNSPSLSVIKTICYPANFVFKTKATMWGINHEDDALFAYKEYCIPFHEGLRVEKVGLCLNPRYPQFGACPDGMVYCECCGRGCIEVKCPFLLKNMSIEKFASLKTSCLIICDDKLFVDKSHMYYYQMHM
jgi:hypothetical protein